VQLALTFGWTLDYARSLSDETRQQVLSALDARSNLTSTYAVQARVRAETAAKKARR
jgi:hypothetical protein